MLCTGDKTYADGSGSRAEFKTRLFSKVKDSLFCGSDCAQGDDVSCHFEDIAIMVRQKCLSKGLMSYEMIITSQSSPELLRASRHALHTFGDRIISVCAMDQDDLEKRGRAIAKRAVSATLGPSAISDNQLGLLIVLNCFIV